MAYPNGPVFDNWWPASDRPQFTNQSFSFRWHFHGQYLMVQRWHFPVDHCRNIWRWPVTGHRLLSSHFLVIGICLAHRQWTITSSTSWSIAGLSLFTIDRTCISNWHLPGQPLVDQYQYFQWSIREDSMVASAWSLVTLIHFKFVGIHLDYLQWAIKGLILMVHCWVISSDQWQAIVLVRQS